MAQAIAKRYASALADVIAKPGAAVSPEQALEQLEAVESLVNEHPELLNVLLSPAVNPDSKHRLVRRIAERLGISQTIQNFVFVVIDHRRVRYLGEMKQAFRDWLDERQGVARIQVRSAAAMEENQRQALVDKFARVTQRQVQAEFSEDPALLGGVVVRHGSTVYDGSLRAQLEALRSAISREAVPYG